MKFPTGAQGCQSATREPIAGREICLIRGSDKVVKYHNVLLTCYDKTLFIAASELEVPGRRTCYLCTGGSPSAMEEGFPGREQDFVEEQTDNDNDKHNSNSNHLIHCVEFATEMKQLAKAETD